MFSSKELAVVANVGSLVQPITRGQYQAAQTPIPSNLFSHADQQQQWQSSVAQGNSPTGWGGRVADYVAAQGINSSKFPTFVSVAGNTLEGSGTKTQMLAIAPGQSLQLAGFNNSAASQARLNALTRLLTLNSGVSLAQAANATMSMSIADAKMLAAALGKAAPLKTQFPTTTLGTATAAGGADHSGAVRSRHAAAGLLLLGRQLRYAHGRVAHAEYAISRTESGTGGFLYRYAGTRHGAERHHVYGIGLQSHIPTHLGGRQDHAWGGHHLVMGGAVHGGQIYGQFPTFELGGPDDTDTRGRWIPTTSIDQYGATLCSWFGIPDSAMNSVFPNLPNFSKRNLGFVG